MKNLSALSWNALAFGPFACGLEPIAEFLHERSHEQELLAAARGLGLGIVEEAHGQVGCGLVVAAKELILGPQPHGVEEVAGGFLLFQGLQPLVCVVEFLFLQERIDVKDQESRLHAPFLGAEHTVHLLAVIRPIALSQVKLGQIEIVVVRGVGALHEIFHGSDGFTDFFLAGVGNQ